MKSCFFVFLIVTLSILNPAATYSAGNNHTRVYLLTCGPGSETYSIYGHSALRIVNHDSDVVYNWGVFDFDTPNFAWKFAKGRLDYMLDSQNLPRFLAAYNYEKRYVVQQLINLDSAETEKLVSLIAENMKPENIRYKYDFFYDDCSTRIRDLLEKVVTGGLVYPPDPKDKPTFRNLTDRYQENYLWLKLGIDLIMGSPGEKKAAQRDRLFLPVDMQEVLSQTLVHRDGKLVPLLMSPVTLLDFPSVEIKPGIISSPATVATLLMIIVIIATLLVQNRITNKMLDLFIYSVYSLLAILILFFNFFTDHQQMRWNLNIIWLSPVIVICLFGIVFNKDWKIWFRAMTAMLALFLVIQFLLPQEFNLAFTPLALLLLARSARRAGFSWFTDRNANISLT
jgi:hypothetical protein